MTALKLKKVKPTEWLGNNMGEATAEWTVAGHENYQLRKLGLRWVAFDTDKPYEDKYGRQRVTQVCFGYSRTECLEMLAVKIGAKLKALLAGWEKYPPSPRKGVAMAKIERKIKELEGK